ncbi:MAG: glutamate--cysteine ligase [Burkholderiaceae bacterium]|nr:MAG: glutamate--cysteine ligase [Burkholderiaceae bacterium]
MPLEAFAQSKSLTLGVELELQLINPHDYDLSPNAKNLLRLLEKKQHPGEIKPEITESMIEISTGICNTYGEVVEQLTEIRGVLKQSADKLDVMISGGGTHPFQQWSKQRIFDAPRFHYLSELYGYLSKQFTIFGQHVHIGCPGPDHALNLLHCLSRYIPHFIALSASSPFVQGINTGFNSARLNSVFAFPLSGRAPFALTWQDFEVYFDKMTRTGVVQGMKDFYWDIRPKPEFGTIEVRVMDTPLTIEKAAQIAAYIQALSRWLTIERPFVPQEDDYLVYTFNRFQACRFGLDGTYVEPGTGEHIPLRDHIKKTLRALENHAAELGSDRALSNLKEEMLARGNDAQWILQLHQEEHSLAEVVRRQAMLWHG